jgi:hypothetical protein
MSALHSPPVRKLSTSGPHADDCSDFVVRASAELARHNQRLVTVRKEILQLRSGPLQKSKRLLAAVDEALTSFNAAW